MRTNAEIKEKGLKWEDLTEQERNNYVNQDYVGRSYILVDPDTFDSEEYSMDSFYDSKLDEYGLEELLSNLTDKQREAIEMYYLKGMTLREIADELKVAHQSVDERIKTAINTLKKIYI